MRYTKKGYIAGCRLVSEFAAIQLKLSGVQVTMLNLFIINWLADKLEKFDKDNPANQLYYFNVYHWAKYYNIPKDYLKYNIIALTRQITCLDGTTACVLFRNKKQRGMYIGMHLSVIHQIVDSELFNAQCDYWKKPELKCPVENGTKIIDAEIKEAEKENMPVPLAVYRQNGGVEPVKPLVEIEDKTNNGVKKGHSEWSESIVKKLCEMADKENAHLFKDGKCKRVFNHLTKKGEFRSNFNIDCVCKLIDDLYTGRFFRNNPVHALFGGIDKKYLEFKNAKLAVERIMYLKGSKDGIRKFLLKCAGNYFDALIPGQDTYQFIKSSFPTTVKSFLLHENTQNGNKIANFLLFYSSTVSLKDKQVHDIKTKIKETVHQSVFATLCNYENCMLENQIQSYWFNVNKLVKEIRFIIKNRETSHFMESCFDNVFKKVNAVSAHYKKVLPGYFDPDMQTAGDGLTEMKDKI